MTTNDTNPTGLRERMTEIARIEAERAAAPTLETIAEMLDTMSQTARDLTAQTRALTEAGSRIRQTDTRRMIGVVALCLILGTAAGTVGALMMKFRLGGTTFPEWNGSRLR